MPRSSALDRFLACVDALEDFVRDAKIIKTQRRRRVLERLRLSLWDTQQDLPPDAARILRDNLWDLYEREDSPCPSSTAPPRS